MKKTLLILTAGLLICCSGFAKAKSTVNEKVDEAVTTVKKVGKESVLKAKDTTKDVIEEVVEDVKEADIKENAKKAGKKVSKEAKKAGKKAKDKVEDVVEDVIEIFND